MRRHQKLIPCYFNKRNLKKIHRLRLLSWLHLFSGRRKKTHPFFRSRPWIFLIKHFCVDLDVLQKESSYLWTLNKCIDILYGQLVVVFQEQKSWGCFVWENIINKKSKHNKKSYFFLLYFTRWSLIRPGKGNLQIHISNQLERFIQTLLFHTSSSPVWPRAAQ